MSANSHRSVNTLVAAMFLLQAFIPVGYMPGRLSEGNFVTFCPDGLPAEVVVTLLGDSHHHHHSADASISFEQCELGGGIFALAHAAPEAESSFPPVSLSPEFPAVEARPAQPRRAFRPRDPPKLQ